MTMRAIPLIVVASTSAARAENVAATLRRNGNQVYVTHSEGGCLRVATSIAPDMVLLDSTLPARLERLLHAHPSSAKAQILHLDDETLSRPRIAEPEPTLHAAA